MVWYHEQIKTDEEMARVAIHIVKDTLLCQYQKPHQNLQGKGILFPWLKKVYYVMLNNNILKSKNM